jgi:hypothetical protein
MGCPDDLDGWLPLDLIEEAVSQAGCRERRRRLLPAAAVMVFVLGLCLFSDEGYGEVARKLAGWLGLLAGRPGWRVPGTSALAKARRRLGAAPFEWLLARLAGPLAGCDTPGAAAFGRLLMTIDGTTVEVPCTPANIAVFGPPQSSRGDGADGGFPQVRVVTLTGCATRGIADVAAGPRKASEQDLARQIAAHGVLGAGMLVLADRNFCGYPVAAPFAATGADLLFRARSSQWLPVLEELADGSYRSVLPEPAAGRAAARARHRGITLPSPPEGLPVRVIEASITATPAGGAPHTGNYRLITTLADPGEAPASAIAALYAERWEAETSYRELKIFQRGARHVLRSATPAGISQELYAMLCAFQLIQAARADAASTGALDPDRISYTVTLRAIRRAVTSTGTRHTIRAEALACLLPARRHRSYPRKMHTTTALRRKARAGLTGTITYKITISRQTPACDPPSP